MRRRRESLTLAPLRQGELDGLCGIYTIINSVRYLCREANLKILRGLFKVLVHSLKQVLDRPLITVWAGMEWRTLLFLAERCASYVWRKLGIRLKITLPPKKMRRERSIDTICRGLGETLCANRLAILSIEGCISHWSVVYSVTPRTLCLFDSSGRRVLRRTCCSVANQRKRFQLDPKAIVFVERVPRGK